MTADTEEFWHSLADRAREPGFGPVQMQDAVFRQFLPMARSEAHQYADAHALNSQLAERAAELGLAEAVLVWRHPNSAGFDKHARAAINIRLQRLAHRAHIPAARRGRLRGLNLT